jgi:hypothetical protein
LSGVYQAMTFRAIERACAIRGFRLRQHGSLSFLAGVSLGRAKKHQPKGAVIANCL